MSDSQLPKAIAAFLRAVHARDIAALLRSLADDALIVDGGREFSGEGLRRWAEGLLADPKMAVSPAGAMQHDGSTIVGIILHGTRPGVAAPLRREWRFTVDGTRIAALDGTESSEPDLPPAVAAFVRATNARDLEGLLAVFAEDAMVNDDLQERWGTAAIRQWAEGEFIGQRVNIFVVGCIARHGIAVVTAHVDGDFDQRGLPYPLVLSFYFSIAGDAVVQLIILRNQQ